MEEIYEMAKETVLVYACPYCEAPIWFNHDYELESHIYNEHLRQALNQIVRLNYKQVKKTHGKWHIY